MTAFPASMYRDPIEAAIRAEEKSCSHPKPGCRHLEKLLDREFCGRGKRTPEKCNKFDLKKGK